MDQLNIWISLLLLVAVAALISPGVIRLNQGKMLRNIALWLGIVLALTLVYRTFGPFGMPAQTLPDKSRQSVDKDDEPENARPKLGNPGMQEQDNGNFRPPAE